MFAGHVAAGLALGRAQRNANVGVFIASALLLDLLLWLFILLGWESVAIPADFGRTHQPAFTFAYSHGLAAALGWSALAAALGWLGWGRRDVPRARFAALIAAAVFSHWLLDALVHRPELPVLGDASRKLGLSLWDTLPWALGLEACITVLGLVVYLHGSRLPRTRKAALALLVLLLLASTIAGMTVAPAPPSAQAMAAASLGTLLVVCLLACWIGSARLVRAADLPDDGLP